jgi:hypothetical protein
MSLMRSLSLFVLGTVSACSQPFTLGANLGIPATRLLGAVDISDIRYQSDTNRYLIGPTRELRLPLGLEARCTGTTASGAQERLLLASTVQNQRPVQPVGVSAAGEIRASDKLACPFVDAGSAWDTLKGFGQSVIVVPARSRSGLPRT